MVALPAYAVLRGGRAAETQYNRFRDAQALREKDLSTPMPSLTVTAAYEKFAADNVRQLPNLSYVLQDSALGGIGKGVGDAIGDVFIRTPVNEATKFLKQKLVTGPKHQAALTAAIENDDVLGQTPRETIDKAHSTLKRFSPALAEDPNAVRSYLRTAVMSHGGVDLATIRMILDAEKTRQQAKGRNVGP